MMRPEDSFDHKLENILKNAEATPPSGWRERAVTAANNAMTGPAAKPRFWTRRKLVLAVMLLAIGVSIGIFPDLRPHAGKEAGTTKPLMLSGAYASLVIKDCPGLKLVDDPMLAVDANSITIGMWPDGKSIYYMTGQIGEEKAPDKIWRLYLASGKRELLVDAKEMLARPSVSPDGKYLVYMVCREGFNLLDLTTGETRYVENSFGARDVSWSPDGQELAFARSHGADVHIHEKAAALRGIWIYSIKDDASRQIMKWPSAESDDKWKIEHFIPYPRWSPDGNWIAFGWDTTEYDDISKRQTTRESKELRVIRPDGRDLHTLLKGGIALSRQCWLPDGKTLVFNWNEVGDNPSGDKEIIPHGITSLDVATGELRVIMSPEDIVGATGAKGWFGRVSCSPASDHLAYTMRRLEKPWELFVASAAVKGAALAIAECGGIPSPPVWANDGKSFLYMKPAADNTAENHHYEIWQAKFDLINK